MGVTLIGPITVPFPKEIVPPIVYTKATWADTWVQDVSLEFVRGSQSSAAHALPVAEVRRRYGSIKQPWEAGFTARASVDLTDFWVKISFVGMGGDEISSFVGQIKDSTRKIMGSDTLKRGRQTWVAYGPQNIAFRAPVSESYFYQDTTVATIGWVPPMNARDENNIITGNRSTGEVEDGGIKTYMYGGTSLWTRRQYAQYVIGRFLDQSNSGGPAWRLGGQDDLLDGVSDVVEFGVTQSVDGILKRLISRDMGVDFKIQEYADGFEVHVFALGAREYSWGGVTLPVNPNTVRTEVSKTTDIIDATVVQSRANQYARVRLLGRRVVNCCTLTVSATELQAAWLPSDEVAYGAGTGNGPTDSAAKHDTARLAERFRDVFRRFNVVKNFDFLKGAADVVVDNASEGWKAGTAADRQDLARGTLTWLPMFKGVDYTTDPPTDNRAAGDHPEIREATVWMQDADAIYQPVDGRGLNLMVPADDFGVFVEGHPNHLIAQNQFGAAFSDEATQTDPEFEYDDMQATIAFEGNHRFKMEYTVPGADAVLGGTKEIVTDAEFWFLAPNTVVGNSVLGALQRSPAGGTVLRNDAARMAMMMAGAIARYTAPRARAVIIIRGHRPWGHLVGHILTVVEEAGDTHDVQAPITSVVWTGGSDPRTIISAGFAR